MLVSRIAAQDSDQSQIAVENVKLRERVAIMIEQGKLKDDLHAKQVMYCKWHLEAEATITTHYLPIIPLCSNTRKLATKVTVCHVCRHSEAQC